MCAALYLPPFWFHQVTAGSASMSLNVWSQDTAAEAAEAIFKEAVPDETEWPVQKRRSFLSVYIRALVDRFREEPNRFAKDMALRFRFMKHGGLRPDAASALASDAPLCCAIRGGAVDTHARVRRGIQALEPHLGLSLLPAVRRLYMQDVVEEVSFHAGCGPAPNCCPLARDGWDVYASHARPNDERAPPAAAFSCNDYLAPHPSQMIEVVVGHRWTVEYLRQCVAVVPRSCTVMWG